MSADTSGMPLASRFMIVRTTKSWRGARLIHTAYSGPTRTECRGETWISWSSSFTASRSPENRQRARSFHAHASFPCWVSASFHRCTAGRSCYATAMKRLSGRRVVLTGASRGIGLETVKLFSAEGAEILGVARDGQQLASLAREVAGFQGLAGDITDRGRGGGRAAGGAGHR